MTTERLRNRRAGEAGFTLVETLVAIVILIFGLIAVTNLLMVAATNNAAANHGTAATAIASERIERFKSQTYNDLTLGTGDEDTVVTGVGPIHTHWEITAMGTRARFIRVTSEASSRILSSRSRAELTTIRTLAEPTPSPSPSPSASPTP